MKMPRARGTRGRNSRWFQDRAGTASVIPVLPSTRRHRCSPLRDRRHLVVTWSKAAEHDGAAGSWRRWHQNAAEKRKSALPTDFTLAQPQVPGMKVVTSWFGKLGSVKRPPVLAFSMTLFLPAGVETLANLMTFQQDLAVNSVSQVPAASWDDAGRFVLVSASLSAIPDPGEPAQICHYFQL
jgi:hypothetical protein